MPQLDSGKGVREEVCVPQLDSGGGREEECVPQLDPGSGGRAGDVSLRLQRGCVSISKACSGLLPPAAPAASAQCTLDCSVAPNPRGRVQRWLRKPSVCEMAR